MIKKKFYKEISIEIFYTFDTDVICSSDSKIEEIGQEWNREWN